MPILSQTSVPDALPDFRNLGVVARILVIVNLTMGMITPPVGGLLFVTSIVARVPLARMVRELWPFLWAQVAVLALLTLVPALSTGLPGAFGYR